MELYGNPVYVTFSPPLTPSQWDLVNKGRYLVSQMVTGRQAQAEATLGLSAQQLVADLYASTRGIDTPLTVAANPLTEEQQGYSWFYVRLPGHKFARDYLPPLAITNQPPPGSAAAQIGARSPAGQSTAPGPASAVTPGPGYRTGGRLNATSSASAPQLPHCSCPCHWRLDSRPVPTLAASCMIS